MNRKHFFIIIVISIGLFFSINEIFKVTYGVDVFGNFFNYKEFTAEEIDWLKEKESIIYGADRNSPPLMYVEEETGQYKGFTIDYLNALSIELETNIMSKAFVWDEALENLMSGDTDMCDMFPSKERAKNFEFSDPIYKLQSIVAVSANNSDINNIKNLEGRSVAVPKGDYGIEYLKENFKYIKFIYTENIEESINLVVEGKADALLGDEPVVAYFLKEKDAYSYVKILNDVAYEREVVLAVKKGNKMLLGILNKGIKSLKSKDTIEKIHQKWFGFSNFFVDEKINESVIILFIFLCIILFIIAYVSYVWNGSLHSEVEKRTEELDVSRKNLQITFDGINSFLMVLDDSKLIKDMNKAFVDFLDMPKEEIIDRNLDEFSFEFKTAEFIEVIDSTLRTKNNVKIEISNENKFYGIKTYSLYKSEEALNKVLIMVDDITKEKSIEAKLLHGSKMSAVGQLAAGVAHEIRNPLGLIRNYNYVLKKRLAGGSEEIQGLLKGIELSVQRASGIIDNLLNFSRIFDDKKEEINICRFIKDICDLERANMEKKRIDFRFICGEDTSFYGNAESLKHVIINLISNSIDAVAEGGKIILESSVADGKFVLVCEDNGIGIKQSDMENIFNPFFTKKVRGKGTGLGLYVTYNEVKKHGGTIDVESVYGEGTKFTVCIPF